MYKMDIDCISVIPRMVTFLLPERPFIGSEYCKSKRNKEYIPVPVTTQNSEAPKISKNKTSKFFILINKACNEMI